MHSFENFVCSHPYFSMLVFISIGILLKSLRRLNWTAVKHNLEDLELALNDKDLAKARYYLQRLKSGFGL